MDKDKREDELSQFFGNIRLIGELRFIRTEIDYWKNKKELQDLNVWEKYPNLAAFITVGIGNLYYDGGNLWGAFEWLTDTNAQNKWGGQFEEFVKAHDSLETFQVLKEKGRLRYVAPILAHGGIPQYCLDDFFKLITKHSDPQSFGSEFINELQENRNWLSNIDTPIKSFLLHGGEVAEAFVSRFLALWSSRDQGDGGGNHGLPERVVEKFGKWFKTNRPTKGKRRKRLPKPGIHISPGDLWVYLFLPRCDDHEEVGPNAIWNYSGKKLAVTRQHKIPLSTNEQWSVELQYGCKSNLSSLHGLTNTLPAIFFDSSTGKMIADPQNRRLPEHLWIVYNREEIVKPEPRYIPYSGLKTKSSIVVDS